MGHGLPAGLVVPLPDVIIRTARLADAFRGRGRPVVYATVPNAYGIMSPGISAGFNEIVPELAPRPAISSASSRCGIRSSAPRPATTCASAA